MHEADKPNSVSNLSYPNILTGKDRTKVNLPSANTDPAALGDFYGSIMERIFRHFRMKVFTSQRCIHLPWVHSYQALVGPVVIVYLDKRIKATRLLFHTGGVV
jgi:hypothetical protein